MDVSTLNLVDICVVEEFDKQCGEVFLSIEGNLSFLCTLCGMKYRGYQEYAEHILEKHHTLNAYIDDASIYSDNQMQTEYVYDGAETTTMFELNTDTSDLKNSTESYMYEAENIMEIEDNNAVITNEESEETCQDYEIRTINPETAKTKSTTLKKQKKKKIHKYSCPKCTFVTNTYSTGMMHLERHKGEKQHICKECSKGFYTAPELRVHERIHTGERPYLCTECGQTFKAYSALWRHTKSCKDIRDKECPECKLKFHNSAALRNHMVVHSELRSYRCEECGEMFKLQKTLRNHMKIHENMHEFECKYCSSSFNQQSGLSSHMKNKHSEMCNSSKNV